MPNRSCLLLTILYPYASCNLSHYSKQAQASIENKDFDSRCKFDFICLNTKHLHAATAKIIDTIAKLNTSVSGYLYQNYQ